LQVTFVRVEGQLMRSLAAAAFLGMAVLVVPACARADLFALDRFDEREDTGIWSRSNQKRLDALVITGVVGLALVEGTENRLGRTAWQATDAALMTAATTEVMKRVFGRPRPSQNQDPTVWFQGSDFRSFPSGEVAMMAAFTTPFIITYQDEHPAVWALAALPLYMAGARMKSQGHWLTDVMAGGAIGAAYGWYATQRDTPLVLSVTKHSVFIGLRYRY
jgi:membrane-associated phospholipid phosphatase